MTDWETLDDDHLPIDGETYWIYHKSYDAVLVSTYQKSEMAFIGDSCRRVPLSAVSHFQPLLVPSKPHKPKKGYF